MIEISSQMREFVNFAQDAVANNGKNSIARLGKQESRFSAFSISAATDGDSVGKLRRSNASKNANNSVRTEFRRTVAQMFGGEDRIPPKVLDAMNIQDYERGKPLTADRILDVYAAIKAHNSGLMNAAAESGTLWAVDVADRVADRFVEKFKADCTPPPSAAVVSNLKRALLLCAANVLDDNALKGGDAAVRKAVRTFNASFKYTYKALGFDAASELRSLASIKKKFLEPVRANLQELRSVAGGNAAILKAGVDALVQSEMTPFKKGVFTKLANGAKTLNLAGLDSISARSTPVQIAKAFTGMYAKFKKSIAAGDYNDPLSRAERNAYTLFFSGVVMSRLSDADKERMVMMFASKAAGNASNIMQTLVTGGTDLSQEETSDLQEAVQIMRKCSTFIADDLSLDADTFAVNEVDEGMTPESIPDDVKAQFAGLVKEIQE